MASTSGTRLLADVVTGLAAGLVGTQVKGWAEQGLQQVGERALPPAPGERDLPGADPAEGGAMPPTLVYRRAAGAVGARTDEDAAGRGAAWLHRAMGYGAALGYTLVSRPVPQLRAGAGSLAGLALFAATHASSLPAAGVQARPSELPRAWWVWEGGSHLAYGLAVDAVVRLGRRVLG